MRSAAALIARDGLQATGLREVADHAQAPRGSIRHHFPGGKAQLTSESLAWIGAAVSDLLDQAVQAPARQNSAQPPLRPPGQTSGDGPAAPGTAAVRVLNAFVQVWLQGLRDTAIATGCSVAAVVHDSDDPALLTRAADVFTAWRQPFQQALTLDGSSTEVAETLATTVLAALEGAVILCRAQGDLIPLEQTAAALHHLLAEPPATLSPRPR